MNTCNNCGTETSHKKYTLCPSCSHLGNKSHLIHGYTNTKNKQPFYQCWVHLNHYHKLSIPLDEFLEEHGGIEAINERLANDIQLHYIDGSFRWASKGSLRGLAKKADGCQSKYIGVSKKISKSGLVTYEANLNGKYIRGSGSHDEDISAAVRDEWILSNNLEDKYRLQVL